jgi:hypothetical protein
VGTFTTEATPSCQPTRPSARSEVHTRPLELTLQPRRPLLGPPQRPLVGPEGAPSVLIVPIGVAAAIALAVVMEAAR